MNPLKRHRYLLLVIAALLSACTTIQEDQYSTIDGLIRVKDWNVDQVWVKPGFAPASYSKIIVAGSGIDFRSVSDRYTPYSRSSQNFPLSETDKLRYKDIIIEEFTQELKKSDAYQFTDSVSPQTMKLSIQVMDVVSNVPPQQPGRNTVYLSEVGRATIALIFSDAVTGETLVSVIDRRSAESYDGLGFKESTPANNWAAVKRLARHWASGLRKGLAEMKQSEPAPGNSE